MIRAVIFDCYGVLVDNTLAANGVLFDYIRSNLKPHYKLGILSNIGAHNIEQLLAPGQLAIFDVTALSFQTGLVKPDPRAYHFVAERLGVPLQDCLFIDDIEHFCAVAKQEGMQAICYRSFSQMKEAAGMLLAKH